MAAERSAARDIQKQRTLSIKSRGSHPLIFSCLIFQEILHSYPHIVGGSNTYREKVQFKGI